jgi:hypothetical protein
MKHSWKGLPGQKRSSLFDLFVSDEEKSFTTLTAGLPQVEQLRLHQEGQEQEKRWCRVQNEVALTGPPALAGRKAS